MLNKGNNDQPVELNPYLAARTEWNERYAPHIQSKKIAWYFASLCLLITVIAVAGVSYIGAQAKTIPYIVAVDDIGRPLAVGRADLAAKADPRVIKAELGSFFSDAFTVMADGSGQKLAVNRVYAHISNSSPAFISMNEYYQQEKNNPFKRAVTETVSIAIRSVIQTTDKTWQVEWTEKLRNRSGEPIGERRMKGAVTVSVVPPTNELTIMKNPLGIYIQNISWSQQF